MGHKQRAVLMRWDPVLAPGAPRPKRSTGESVSPDLATRDWRALAKAGSANKYRWVKAPGVRCLSGARGRAAFDAAAAAVAAAVAAGAPSVFLVGRAPQGRGHEWLGEYRRAEAEAVGRRAVYVKRGDARKALWYAARVGSWMAGPRARAGRARGALSALDGAVVPEGVRANWSVWRADAARWEAAPGLRCVGGAAWQAEQAVAAAAVAREVARGARTVFIVGGGGGGAGAARARYHDALGAYEWRAGGGANASGGLGGARAVYARRGGGALLYYDVNVGEWTVALELEGGGALSAPRHAPLLAAGDDAPTPERIAPSTVWRGRVPGSGRSRGARAAVGAWVEARGVRCLRGRRGAAQLRADGEAAEATLGGGAARVWLVGNLTLPHQALLGEYARQPPAPAPPTAGGGSTAPPPRMPLRRAYHLAGATDGETGGRATLWFDEQRGLWLVGPASTGRGALAVADRALLPERTREHSWAVVGRGGALGATRPDLRCLSGARGRAAFDAAAAAVAAAVAAGAPSVFLVGRAPQGRGHEWLGEYRRAEAEAVGRRAVYVKRGDARKALWYAARVGSWMAGPRARAGRARGALSALDGAVVPEGVRANWSVWRADAARWEAAPGLRCVGGAAGRAELEASHAAAEREVARGARTVFIVGALPAAAWRTYTGAYERLPRGGGRDVRGTFAKRDAPQLAIWYVASRGEWHVGELVDAGRATGVLYAYDSALVPEDIEAAWAVGGHELPPSCARANVDVTGVHVAVGEQGWSELAADEALGRLEGSLEPGWLFWPRREAVLLRLSEAVAAGVSGRSIRAAIEVARSKRVPAATLSAAQEALAAAQAQAGAQEKPPVEDIEES